MPAFAHAFGIRYTLPIPLWLYMWGAAAALALSFLMLAYFMGAPADALRDPRTCAMPVAWNRLRAPWLLGILRLLSVALLLLSIVSGLIGTPTSDANFNMTFFWIVVLLGYAYWVALFGNSYDILNPWRVIVEAIERFAPRVFAGRRGYPPRLGYYPAVLLYTALVWEELFGDAQPRSLSVLLIAYTLISLAGACWWGKRAWFECGDVFGVLFRVIGKIAPLQWAGHRFRLRPPFVGLLDEPCPHMSLLLFILFMLSSTAFDALHDALAVKLWYWNDVAGALRPILGTFTDRPYPALERIYLGLQTLGLLVSPLLYLSVYLVLMWVTKRLLATPIPLRRLCLEFGYSLLPIAFAYNIAHYFTLAVSQGPQIIRLASDPFGYNWNLFGTRDWLRGVPILLDGAVVWHVQVAVILVGHVVGVFLAHRVALGLLPSGRAATLSQLPMLALMMSYTTVGLRILSLPLS